MRKLFSSDDKELPFPFYGMTIHVPGGWKVRDAMYPNRIDLESGRRHLKIWFKKSTDNDDIVFDKSQRRVAYEGRFEKESRPSLVSTDRVVGRSSNAVYFEYLDRENNPDGKCNWLSMVYGTCEIQIALTRGNIDDVSTRREFDAFLGGLEF